MADVVTLPGTPSEKPKRTLTFGGSISAQLQYDLDTIKDDLGIPAGDTSNDAWLDRRIAGIWARIERYTHRYLAVPPATFIDDWSLVASAYGGPNEPPPLAFPPLGSPFLRCCPVVSVDAITSNSQTLDAAGVRFEARTGKLFTLTAPSYYVAHDVSQELVSGMTKITYKAGWDAIPADLYEALLGALGVLWQGRQGQQAGGTGAGGVTSINVVDVGTVEMGSDGNAFVAASTRGVRINDPLLGPWEYLLQEYIDVRVQIGSPLIPVTTFVPPP